MLFSERSQRQAAAEGVILSAPIVHTREIYRKYLSGCPGLGGGGSRRSRESQGNDSKTTGRFLSGADGNGLELGCGDGCTSPQIYIPRYL